MNYDAIDSLLTQLQKVGDVPGLAVAIVQGDETYCQGYGVRSLAAETATPDNTVTADTLFANASTTKAVTATAVALLVDAGKMQWDDPVRKFLPDFRLSDPSADALVTIRDLLCHRTGLTRHDMLWYRSAYDRKDILHRVCQAKLTAPIRTQYQYQNIAFLVAGEAVRVASGSASFEAFVRERLLLPLGMTRTNFSTHDAEADPNHAEPHKRLNGTVTQTPYLNFDNCGPCGSMNSCVSEMLSWLRFNLGDGTLPDGSRLLSEKQLRELHAPQMIIPVSDETRARYPYLIQETYCLGWSLGNYKNGLGWLNHGGAIDGFRAHVTLIPSAKLGLCLFCNLGGPFMEPMRNALVDFLLDLPPDDWAALLKEQLEKGKRDEDEAEQKREQQRKDGKSSPLRPPDYAGTYTDPAYGTLTLSVTEKDALHLSWNRYETALRHQTFTTFVTLDGKDDFGINEVTIELTPTGTVAAVHLFEGRFLPDANAVPKATGE